MGYGNVVIVACTPELAAMHMPRQVQGAFPATSCWMQAAALVAVSCKKGSTCMHAPHSFSCHSAGETLAYLHPQSGARAPVQDKRRQRLHHHGTEHRLSPLHHL